jgi:hypothetical protein
MRILIVEDDEVIASTMSRGLTLHGYVVDHVPTAEAASTALLNEHFYGPPPRRAHEGRQGAHELSKNSTCPPTR